MFTFIATAVSYDFKLFIASVLGYYLVIGRLLRHYYKEAFRCKITSVSDTTRVARLGDFSPIGLLITHWATFC